MEKEDKKQLRKAKINKKRRDKREIGDYDEYRSKVKKKRDKRMEIEEEDNWEDWDRFYHS